MNSYSLINNDIVLDTREGEYVLAVRDLPLEEKPREKLIAYGPSALSEKELLAIILNTGTKKEEIFLMTSRILKDYGENILANQTNPRVLEHDLKIPLVKACQIVATFELGRRYFKKSNVKAIVRTPKDAYEYFKDMAKLPKEHLRGIYLNSRHRVIHDEIISIGTLTSSLIHPREVFRPALEHQAAAVIIAHNHPSNNKKPTKEDIAITKQLTEAGRLLGIDLLDHLIITKNGFEKCTK